MTSLKKPITLWTPVVVWASLIFFLSSLSTLPSPKIIWWDFLLKKSAHVFEYAILFFLIVRALEKRTLKTYLIAFALSLLYAISDEFHQSFVSGRHSKPMDVGFDSLGMIISYLKLTKFPFK